MKLILISLMGFAWAIGGEKYFGKWKRGILVSAVSIAIGVYLSLPWYALVTLGAMFYLYQLLFYDMGIKMIWPAPYTAQNRDKLLGWLILIANGLICGLFPMTIRLFQAQWVRSGIDLILAAIGFCLICILSNGLKWSWNGCLRVKEVKIWCPADSWWWACWIYGLILGAVSIYG